MKAKPILTIGIPHDGESENQILEMAKSLREHIKDWHIIAYELPLNAEITFQAFFGKDDVMSIESEELKEFILFKINA